MCFRWSHTWQGEPRKTYETEGNSKCLETLKRLQNSKDIKIYLSIRIIFFGNRLKLFQVLFQMIAAVYWKYFGSNYNCVDVISW